MKMLSMRKGFSGGKESQTEETDERRTKQGGFNKRVNEAWLQML